MHRSAARRQGDSVRRYVHLDAGASGLEATLGLLLAGTGLAGAAITLVDETTRYPFLALGAVVIPPAPREKTVCGQVVATGQPVVQVAQTVDPDDPRRGEFEVGTYVGVPLVGGEGAVVGALCLADAHVRPVPEALVAELLTWARVVQDQLELLRRRTEASLPPSSRSPRLAEAIEQGQIVPWYQPIVDLGTGEVVGYEALARWEHPTRGVLEPAQFMAEAEDGELVIDLDLAVLSRAAQDLCRWRTAEPSSALRMNVNLSSRHLDHDECTARLISTTRAAGCSPSWVSFELTEHVEISPTHQHARFLQGLRDEGFSVLLDDLGSGWSYLENLVHLPVDGFKIDRSVASALGRPVGAAVVKALAEIGRTLGMSTTIEGIETQAAAGRARHAGVVLGQGYLWAPAKPAAELPHPLGGVPSSQGGARGAEVGEVGPARAAQQR